MALFVATEECRVCLSVGESHHDSRDLCGDRTIVELLRKHLEIEIVGDEAIFVCCGCLHVLREINKLRRVADANSKAFMQQAFRMNREYETETGDSSANTLFSPPMNHRCNPWPAGLRAYSTPIPVFPCEEPDDLRLLRDPMPQSPRIYESVWGSEAVDSEDCLEEDDAMRPSRSTNSIDLPQYQTFRSFASSTGTVSGQNEPQTTASISESDESPGCISDSGEVAYLIKFS